jgi:hypothetical protein
MNEPIKLPDCTAGELKAAIDRLTGGDDSMPVWLQCHEGHIENAAVIYSEKILRGPRIVIEGVFLP